MTLALKETQDPINDPRNKEVIMGDHHLAQLKQEDKQQLLTFIEDFLQRSKLPGISVALNVNDTKVEVSAGISDLHTGSSMTTHSRFELGCFNKLLIALVVLELANDGKIVLEQKISSYLPELKGCNGDIVKVKHLLSHTGGYQDDHIGDPDILQDSSYKLFVNSFNNRKMHFEPGRVFNYSHSSSVILKEIIEKVTSRKARTLIKELILKPLGITVLKAEHFGSSQCTRRHRVDPETSQFSATLSVEPSSFWEHSLSGGWIRMCDLVKIGNALVNGKTFSKLTKQALISSQVDLPGLFTDKISESHFFKFGLGLARYPEGDYGLGSASVGQCIAVRIDKSIGSIIAIGINAESPDLRDYCINKITNALIPENKQVISRLRPLPIELLELKLIVGDYEGAQGQKLNIEKGDRKLIVILSDKNSNTLLNFEIDMINEYGLIKIIKKPMMVPIGFFKDDKTKFYNISLYGTYVYKHL